MRFTCLAGDINRFKPKTNLNPNPTIVDLQARRRRQLTRMLPVRIQISLRYLVADRFEVSPTSFEPASNQIA